MGSDADRAVLEIQFLQKFQRLLDSGSFSATYKFALLIALTNLAVKRGSDGAEPLRLTFDELAREFVTLYWTHARPYPGSEALLRQNTGKPAKILGLIEQAIAAQTGRHHRKPEPRAIDGELIKRVATLIAVMPVWKLQTVGKTQTDPDHEDHFLYPNTGRGRAIELRAGVVGCMRRFRGLITALAQARWAEWIRVQNGALLGSGTDLERFLFGQDRVALSEFADLLCELQAGKCFYTNKKLGPDRGRQVDHFIPWSRYPTDSPFNLVLACGPANGAKSDHLASVGHLRNWLQRNSEHAAALRRRADVDLAELGSARAIARWAYQQAESLEDLVWERCNVLVPLGPEWKQLLA